MSRSATVVQLGMDLPAEIVHRDDGTIAAPEREREEAVHAVDRRCRGRGARRACRPTGRTRASRGWPGGIRRRASGRRTGTTSRTPGRSRSERRPAQRGEVQATGPCQRRQQLLHVDLDPGHRPAQMAGVDEDLEAPGRGARLTSPCAARRQRPRPPLGGRRPAPAPGASRSRSGSTGRRDSARGRPRSAARAAPGRPARAGCRPRCRPPTRDRPAPRRPRPAPWCRTGPR